MAEYSFHRPVTAQKCICGWVMKTDSATWMDHFEWALQEAIDLGLRIRNQSLS